MEKHYDFKTNDPKLYQYWEENNLFSSEPNENKIPYCILQPPPNRSGILHLGHALNNTIQDILIRYHKLNGYNVLWVFGTDHGGISSSSSFEKELLKQNQSRQILGKKLFAENLHNWMNEKGENIKTQLKKMGYAFDMSREQYTLNDHFSDLVMKTFVKLYNDELIYRGKYIVNWCPRCATALADDEVEEKNNEKNNCNMYYIKYKIVDSDQYVTVATTRPETMFGDTAIAFNPSDERYVNLENKEAYIPIINRKIKFIKDHAIHKNVGSGLVKITPAHNRTDYYIGKTHNLDTIQIINEKCKMFNTNTKYDGLDRFKCRKELVFDLQELGLIENIKTHTNKSEHCYRCQTIIEPYWSDQWFVKMAPLSEFAQKVINDGEIQLIPDYQTKIFNVWTNKNMDWCISRQISNGHMIPIWYCDCGNIICQEIPPIKCNKCNSEKLERDQDVLDTWFSSALWGHGVFEKENDFNYYFPTNTLVTGKDILYFWVARMIMISLYITGKIPFKKVLLHGIVRDVNGDKMSKSKGNGIDPLNIIDKYGADALRYTLMYNLPLGEDIGVSMKSFDLGKAFCTKLWNATRYVLMNISESGIDSIKMLNEYDDVPNANEFDKWIMLKMSIMNSKFTQFISEYNFSGALKILSDFFWNDFCNMYLEITKNYIDNIDTKKILILVISKIIKMYHPFVPFITEELWSNIKKFFVDISDSIMEANWPQYDDHNNNNFMETEYFVNMIYKTRTLKDKNNYDKVLIISDNISIVEFINKNKNAFGKLVKIDNIDVVHDDTKNEIILSNL